MDESGASVLSAGAVTLWVGGRQPDERSDELAHRAGLRDTLLTEVLALRGKEREVVP